MKVNPFFDLFLFLGFFNLFGRQTYVLVLAVVLYLCITQQKTILFNLNSAAMFSWVVIYFVWTLLTYGLSISQLLFPIVAFSLYMLGIGCTNCRNTETEFAKIYLIAATGMLANGILNFALNLRKYGWDFGGRRVLIDIWDGELLATGQAALFVPIIGIMYYIFVIMGNGGTNKERWIKAGYILGCLLSIVYNIMSASRYVLYVSIVLLLLCAVVDIIWQKNTEKLSRFLKLLSIVCVVIVLYNINLFGFKSWFENSALANRLENIESQGEDTVFTSEARIAQIKDVLSNIGLYLWGGKPTGYEFIHNTWLSSLNSGGILTALPLLIFSISNIAVSISVMKRASKGIALFVLGSVISIYGFMMIEPVIESARGLFYFFCLEAGMLNGMDYQLRSKSSESALEVL